MQEASKRTYGKISGMQSNAYFVSCLIHLLVCKPLIPNLPSRLGSAEKVVKIGIIWLNTNSSLIRSSKHCIVEEPGCLGSQCFMDPGEAGPLLLGGEVGGWLSFFLEAPLLQLFLKSLLL